MGSYTVYDENGTYFTYEGLSRQQPVLPYFGNKNTADTRWSDLWNKIDDLNNNDNGDVYKVIFFGRHGLATNSSLTEWDDNNDDVWAQDVPLLDPPLSQEGYLQVCNVLSIWQNENSLGDGKNIGIPNISYCSPMMRALVTNSITFYPQLAASTITTVIREDCREKISRRGECIEHRRSKKCIHEMFPMFTIEDGFADYDPYWGNKESSEDIVQRGNHILASIFDTGNDDKNFVSITAHGGIIDAVFDIVGFSGKIHHGGVIPLICLFEPDEDDDDE